MESENVEAAKKMAAANLMDTAKPLSAALSPPIFSQHKEEEAKNEMDIAAKLTDDIIAEILSRLPFKSICRFKCVSKSWFAISSHPSFLSKLPRPLAGFFSKIYKWDTETSTSRQTAFFTTLRTDVSASDDIDTALTFLPHRDLIRPLDCCNWLLLCCCWSRPPGHDGQPVFHYYVCNPATRKWTAVPGCAGGCHTLALAFDPTNAAHGFHVLHFKESGVGGDLKTTIDDDMLANGMLEQPRVLNDRTSFVTSLEVFSSQSGEWVPSRLGCLVSGSSRGGAVCLLMEGFICLHMIAK